MTMPPSVADFIVTPLSPRRDEEAVEETSLQIVEVGSHSPAAHLGLSRGDWVTTVEGYPAAEIGVHAGLFDGDTQRYGIAKAMADGTRACFEVTTRCVPLGVAVGPTAAAMRVMSARGDANPSKLYHWWVSGDFQTLRELTETYIEAPERGFFARLRSRLRGDLDWRETPALLMRGAWRYEAGEYELGMADVEAFRREQMDGWTTNFHAVVHYYLAKDLARRAPDQRTWAAEHAFRALDYDRNEQTEALYRALGGVLREVPEAAPARFPVDYTLAGLEGSPDTHLGERLASLGKHQRLVVCNLSDYRGNSPYDTLLFELDALMRAAPECLAEVHVIAGQATRPSDRAYWFESEERARKAGRPLRVLFDPDQTVAAATRAKFSPEMYVLDREGRVRAKGTSSGMEIWKGLFDAPTSG